MITFAWEECGPAEAGWGRRVAAADVGPRPYTNRLPAPAGPRDGPSRSCRALTGPTQTVGIGDGGSMRSAGWGLGASAGDEGPGLRRNPFESGALRQLPLERDDPVVLVSDK